MHSGYRTCPTVRPCASEQPTSCGYSSGRAPHSGGCGMPGIQPSGIGLIAIVRLSTRFPALTGPPAGDVLCTGGLAAGLARAWPPAAPLFDLPPSRPPNAFRTFPKKLIDLLSIVSIV